MKLYVNCWQCALDHTNPDTSLYPVQVTDSGIIHFPCKRGHEAVVQLYDDRYELLFDSGASALFDGYPREAVASFAASIERFYEYVTKLLARTEGVSQLLVDGVWKDISKRSECQLGAFRFTHLLHFKLAAPEMPHNWIKFRNDVTHNGIFPSYEKAVEYGQYCLDHIETIFDSLRDPKYVTTMHELAKELADDRRAKVPKGQKPLLMIRRGIIYHVVNPDNEKITLASWLEEQKKDRARHERWKMWQMVKQEEANGYILLSSERRDDAGKAE